LQTLDLTDGHILQPNSRQWTKRHAVVEKSNRTLPLFGNPRESL
jgi:hypothetical protein